MGGSSSWGHEPDGSALTELIKAIFVVAAIIVFIYYAASTAIDDASNSKKENIEKVETK